jgi:hypothetical protein
MHHLFHTHQACSDKEAKVQVNSHAKIHMVQEWESPRARLDRNVLTEGDREAFLHQRWPWWSGPS